MMCQPFNEHLPKEYPVPDLNAIREHLLQRQAELRSRAERANADLRRERDPLAADFADQAVQRSNDEVLAAIGDSARAELSQISQALRRIDAGQYTLCAVCGSQIVAQRLETVPYTDRCARCAA
jgi:RNA polymerase-binding transcription factor DksA